MRRRRGGEKGRPTKGKGTAGWRSGEVDAGLVSQVKKDGEQRWEGQEAGANLCFRFPNGIVVGN